jgi:hypothetical protein
MVAIASRVLHGIKFFEQFLKVTTRRTFLWSLDEIGFGIYEEMSFEVKVYGRTSDRHRTKSNWKSSPCHFVTGELKSHFTLLKNNSKCMKLKKQRNQQLLSRTLTRVLCVLFQSEWSTSNKQSGMLNN